MSNVYLEKIALTVEDVRSARKAGDKAHGKTAGKWTAAGLGAGALAGAGLSYKALRKIPFSRREKLVHAGISAAAGGLIGASSGLAASASTAEQARYRAQTRVLNRGLAKSAALTERQVRDRSLRNDELAGLAAIPGTIAGGVAGGATAYGVGVHKGMKESGGYQAIKNSLRNSYLRKKNKNVDLGNGATLMGKEKQLTLYTGNRSAIARRTGDVISRVMGKTGLAAAGFGAAAGMNLAINKVRKHTDKADVGYYKMLSGKNGK